MKKILLINIFIFLVISLFAQENDTLTNETNLDEIIISATKFAEHKRNIAQDIQVISMKQIKFANTQNTADLLERTANINIQKSQQGGGSTVIRGFEASKVLYIVDGVRLNNLIYRAGHLQNIITIDQTILNKIEVLYGPSSTVYGSNALGGVIHLQTKNPELATGNKKTNFGANAFFRFGTVNNEKSEHLDFTISNKKFGSLTSLTFSDFGDLKMGGSQNMFYDTVFGERNFYVERINGKDSIVANKNPLIQKYSGYSQYDFLQKFLFQQTNKISHILNIQYSNSSNVPRYDRLTDISGGKLKFAEWYYGPQERIFTSYQLNMKNSMRFDNISLLINYQEIEESRIQRRFNKNGLQTNSELVNVMGANLDFNKILNKNEIRFGCEFFYNTLKSTASELDIITNETSKLDTRYPDGDNVMYDFSAYYTHTLKVSKNFVINDGIRLGYSSLYSSITEKSVIQLPYTEISQKTPVYSGSLGLIFLPKNDLKIVLNISTGFRVPNVDDMSKIFESAAGSVIVPNEKLKPEKTLNCDFNIDKVFNNKIMWENTIYGTYYFDAIVASEFTFNGQTSIMYNDEMSKVYANQNMQRAYIYGANSNLKAQFYKNFSLVSGVNYTYGRILTDTIPYPLDHIPPFAAKLLLNYNLDKLNINFFANYNSAKKIANYNLGGEDNEQYATPDGMPAWMNLNFDISYQLHKNILLQVGINNILDTQYRTFASGINAAGRNIFAVLRLNI